MTSVSTFDVIDKKCFFFWKGQVQTNFFETTLAQKFGRKNFNCLKLHQLARLSATKVLLS